MGSRVKRRKGKKKKKKFLWTGGVIGIILLMIGLYIFYQVGSTFSDIHNPLTRDIDEERDKELTQIIKKNETINLLLLGVDERPGDKGRSDTIILMSLNPRTDSILMLSIPRDTYVHIPGHGMDKINHAYAFGDVELSIQTVEEVLRVPVHFYAKVNMDGFKEGIDAIGGVTVQNELAFSQGEHHFPEGPIHLNGDQALDYIRMRNNDPQGDIGRNKRQRMLIEAAMSEAASFSSITKIGPILNILGDNVQTDLTLSRMQSLFSDYRNTRKNIETIELNGSGQFIGPTWYYVVSDDEFNRVHRAIIDHMEAS